MQFIPSFARQRWYRSRSPGPCTRHDRLGAEPSTSSSAPQVHQAEVAGAAGIAAQVKAGEGVYQTVCLACHQATARACPARSRRWPAPTTCWATRIARSAWSCAASRAKSW